MPLKHTFSLEPRDLLFLRDARPMAASDAGLGANWPRPDQLWYAVINAFHGQWPERQPWEGTAHTKRPHERQESSDRFGALKTVGPFPCKAGVLYLPCPLDLGMALVACEGTDLPQPLTHAFRPKKLGKTQNPAWLSASDYARYLERTEALDMSERSDSSDLYDIERNIGIAINAEHQTAEKGQLYQAEYLRLRAGVSLAFAASCDIQPRGGSATLDVFTRPDRPDTLVIGGQQGIASLRSLDAGLTLPQAEITTRRLRWTLIAPAVFNAGWRPDWVAEDGRVMLPNAERAPGVSRAAWKAQAAAAGGFPTARLVAARVGKPLAFSGWDLQDGGPKPTLLAVPAGTCYVFDCDTPDEARALATALAPGRPRSTRFGEKGFGIGICSSLPTLS